MQHYANKMRFQTPCCSKFDPHLKKKMLRRILINVQAGHDPELAPHAWPSGHVVHEVDASGAYLPAGQSSHEVFPLSRFPIPCVWKSMTKMTLARKDIGRKSILAATCQLGILCSCRLWRHFFLRLDTSCTRSTLRERISRLRCQCVCVFGR